DWYFSVFVDTCTHRHTHTHTCTHTHTQICQIQTYILDAFTFTDKHLLVMPSLLAHANVHTHTHTARHTHIRYKNIYLRHISPHRKTRACNVSLSHTHKCTHTHTHTHTHTR